jgi:hypothetical protein
LDGPSETPLPELIMETGATSENSSPSETRSLPSRMMVVLSADELAAAITQAHDVKMSPDKFALESAEKILKLLPPLYYEPRSER